MGLGDMMKETGKAAAKSGANSAQKPDVGDCRSVGADNSGQQFGNIGDGGDSYSNDNHSGHIGEGDTFDSGDNNTTESDLGKKGAEKLGDKAKDSAGNSGSGSNGSNGFGSSDGGASGTAGNGGASGSAGYGGSANGMSGNGSTSGADATNAANAAAQSATSTASAGAGGSAAAGGASAAGSAAAGSAAAGTGASIGSTIGHALSSLGTAISGALGSAVSTITGAGAAVTNAVSSAFGIASTTAATAVTSAAVAGAVAVGAVAVGAVVMNSAAASIDDLVSQEDCSTNVDQATAAANEVDADAAMLENAKQIYSVFKTRGWSDNMIAGMLSNFQAEGSIDPTCIEGIYDEPYTMGTKKTAAVNDNFKSQCSYLFNAYANQGLSINQSAYQADDGNYYPGLGLCQWTGPGAKRLIDYAKSVNKDWYGMDFQIAYIIANGSPCIGTSFEEKYKSECSSSDATACAEFFAYKFENGAMPSSMVATHTSSASSWASQMSSWTVDSSYANSVISMAEQMGASAASSTVADATKTCQKAASYDNSSLANAAVAYAWPSTKAATGNNGTQLYQAVHDTVYPGDGYYMSCDRGVACAVKWSGTDVDYPAGGCAEQYRYCTASDKWQAVGVLGQDIQYDQLQPGDVAILSGEHTWVYVGNDAVKAKYSDSSYNSVNASFGSRSAGCSDDSWSVSGDSRGRYTIFRCVKPDNSTEYKDAGAGKSGTS